MAVTLIVIVGALCQSAASERFGMPSLGCRCWRGQYPVVGIPIHPLILIALVGRIFVRCDVTIPSDHPRFGKLVAHPDQLCIWSRRDQFNAGARGRCNNRRRESGDDGCGAETERGPAWV